MSDAATTSADPLIVIEGPEQSRLDPALGDGGLPPVVGAQSWQVFRASRAAADLTDGRGWTYHHHVDIACWRGRLYVAWNSCEKDEDVWPSRELYSTSADGASWSTPLELFPQGISTPLRMYFFLAPNGRMLAIAGLRLDTADTSEDRKSGLVVREIRPDHTFGPVYTLQLPSEPAAGAHPPMFDISPDEGFIAACRQLLADRVFLEQQDLGRLLGDRRMKWHNASAWPDGRVPGDNAKWVCGKAWSFFRRRDGLLVGISKMGWTTSSNDDGRTWSQPCVPPTLITGKAKVWTTRTPDGGYALVYNPSTRQRYPLAIVTGEDGRTFRDMRIVQGELPRQRYEGMHRSIGPQYTRGLSPWSDDGSRAGDSAMWLVYSMNKEDIWVSRVPIPVQADEPPAEFAERLDDLPPGPIVPRWNTYAPRWTKVAIEPKVAAAGGGLWIESRDPYDYARAVRVLGPREKVTVSFDLFLPAERREAIEIELLEQFGPARPVRLRIDPAGALHADAVDGTRTVASLTAGQWVTLTIAADTVAGHWSLWRESACVLSDASFAESASTLHRISFRTGPYRSVGGADPVDPATDRPVAPTAAGIRNFHAR